jgi:hypothetical protein
MKPSSQPRGTLAKLLGMTGRAIETCPAVHLHDWNGDPYSRGAYSYVTVDGPSAPVVLARPVRGTIFFAGEHASRPHGGGWGHFRQALRRNSCVGEGPIRVYDLAGSRFNDDFAADA